MASEAPTLVFLSTSGVKLTHKHGLVSSLQSFESCLYLVALRRFPHAFTVCAFAIESAVKAIGGRVGQGHFLELLTRARDSGADGGPITDEQLREFVGMRNRIVHSGFSPRDDRTTAGLILEVGLPLLGRTYLTHHELNLDISLFDALQRQLSAARSAFLMTGGSQSRDATQYWEIVGHSIRTWLTRRLDSAARYELLEGAESRGLAFDIVEPRRVRLLNEREPSWGFDCPSCDAFGTLVCTLEGQQLDHGVVSLRNAECVACDLRVAEVPYLLDETMREAIASERRKILIAYGIVVSEA